MLELAKLNQAFVDAASLESVAIIAAMVMPHLLLQCPSKKLKGQPLSSCLACRLDFWCKGNIIELLEEARTIQNNLKCKYRKA